MHALLSLAAVLVSAMGAVSQTSSVDASVGVAAVEQTVDPPAPPAGASKDQVRAWIAQHIDEGAYAEAAVDSNRVILYDPATLEKLPDGHVIVWVRSELFRPRLEGALALRSVRKKLEIDCSALRYKELAVEGYGGLNLQRPVAGMRMFQTWTKSLPETSSAGMANRAVCNHAFSHP